MTFRSQITITPLITDRAKRAEVARRSGYKLNRRGEVVLRTIAEVMTSEGSDKATAIEGLRIEAAIARNMLGLPVAPIRRGRATGPSVVYFMSAIGSDVVKIGHSTSLRSRFDSLKNAGGVQIRLLAIMPGGPEQERVLHKRYAAARTHGEWFRLTPALQSAITKARALSPLPSWALGQ